MMIAARSYSGISEDERTRDLFRDQSEIDNSSEGRRRAVERYWNELADELELREGQH